MAQTSRSNPAIGGAVPTQCDATPSTNDVDVTKALAEAATLLGIELLDHVVIGDEAVSLRERGLFG